MNREIVLYAYRYSVYARIVRVALIEKGVPWREVETDPFAKLPQSYLEMNPFGRVPTLVDGPFALYETVAITRYIDEGFEGPSLQPADARERARMAQIIAIADSYAYWPLIRQVFSHRVFRPAQGERGGEAVVRAGLEQGATVLAALEGLVGSKHAAGGAFSLADLHLAPIFDYFIQAPEGAAMVARYPTLSKWWDGIRQRRSLVETDPGLPGG